MLETGSCASGYGCHETCLWLASNVKVKRLIYLVPPLSRAIVQQEHMLCTLSRGASDVRSAVGVEFYRCKSKDTTLLEGYRATVGLAAKQPFRAQWAPEPYKDASCRKPRLCRTTEDITDANCVTFVQLVVQYGGWSLETSCSRCTEVREHTCQTWAALGVQLWLSGLIMCRVVSVKNQERIHKAWSLVTKAEMQIGDGQPCLFSDDYFPPASSFLVCQRADVGVFCQSVVASVLSTLFHQSTWFLTPLACVGLPLSHCMLLACDLSSCISSYPIDFVSTR